MQQRCSISDGIKIKSKYFSFCETSLQYVISKDFEREENVTQLSKVFLHGRSLVKKTRFSPQHFGIHEAWPGQILRHRKIIYIQIQLLNNCSPRSLLWPSIILISDLHLYFTAFWRGLQPGSAMRWTVHHCLWLIDWLSRVPPSVAHSLLPLTLVTLLVSGATCTPQRFPFSISSQDPQTDSTNPSLSFWWLLHHFCSGFTSPLSQSTAGKAATWDTFHLSATP